MFVKIMSCEDLPDQHYAKSYLMFECKSASFIRREDEGPIVVVDGEEHGLNGNAYILNSAGKTIDSFAVDASGK